MTPPPVSAGRRRLQLAAVFVLFQAVLLMTWMGWQTVYDTESMLAVTRAILFEHGVTIGLPGKGYRGPSLYGLGQSVLFAPAVLIARFVPPPSGISSMDFEYLLASLTNPIVVAALGSVLFAAGRALSLSLPRALFLAALGSFGTPLWNLTQYQMSEPATAIALLGAALALSPRASSRRHVVAGLLFGFAVLCRPVELVLLPALAIGWLFDLRSARGAVDRPALAARIAAAGAGLAPMIAIHLAYNQARFGRMLVTGYPGGANVAFKTTRSVGEGLWVFLWSPSAGLPWFAPVVVLGLLAAPLSLRSRPVIAIAAVLGFMAQLFIHVRSGVWLGGPFWGPRYLVPVMPLAVLCVAPLLARGGVPALAAVLVGAASIGINLLGALHDTVNTHRHMMPMDDLLGNQLARLTPVDLVFHSLAPTSGTFWPTFTTFGTALLVVVGLALTAIVWSSGRLRVAHLALWIALPACFVLARERFIPYRALAPSISWTATGSIPIDLSTAVVMRGRVNKTADGLWLSRGRALLTARLHRGAHRFRIALTSEAGAAYQIWFSADLVASGELPPGVATTVVTSPVQIRRLRSYPLIVGIVPSEANGRPSALCRSVEAESLAAAP